MRPKYISRAPEYEPDSEDRCRSRHEPRGGGGGRGPLRPASLHASPNDAAFLSSIALYEWWPLFPNMCCTYISRMCLKVQTVVFLTSHRLESEKLKS